ADSPSVALPAPQLHMLASPGGVGAPSSRQSLAYPGLGKGGATLAASVASPRPAVADLRREVDAIAVTRVYNVGRVEFTARRQ
ncbi:MAG: hypothetical protein M3186_08045, partial [Actinomycetota bacterium]|nr:hypothetical protein [Actinomycetota bacterium]